MEIHARKGLRRIILLERKESGVVIPQTLWRSKKSKKKKKGSKNLRGLERGVRSAGEAQQNFTNTLLKRHRSSNRKRKDGWLRDLGTNVFKAYRKGSKKVKNPTRI